MTSTIKVDTIAEHTSGGGVTVDGLTIKDGGITATTGATVFNEGSVDVDFRVESNDQTHMLFVDGGNNAVGIGQSSPADFDGGADNLVIGKTTDSSNGITIAADDNSIIYFADGTSGDERYRGSIIYNHPADNFIIRTAGFNTRMTIDSAGAVTMPLQPCFRVGSGTQDNIPVSSNQTAIFSVEIFDIGADFGSNTFTAPVTGKYFFTVSFRLSNLDSAASYLQTVLVGSNRNTTLHTLSEIGNHISADTEYSHTGTAILDMDANDTASVQIRIQSGTAQTDVNTDGSYFSGFLIG